MPYTAIFTQTQNNVALITLNRPRRRNAITHAMLDELAQALKIAAKDRQTRAIVLTGAEHSFCAGQDLAEFGEESSPNYVYKHVLRSYRPVIQLLTTIEKPIIAAINGVAAGAGASLALACDLRIMAADASLLLAFSNIALLPDAGATWFLVRAVGYSRAYEIAIEGEKIPAKRCLELGLTNKIAPAGELLPAALKWAEKLAQRPTFSLGLTKRAMNKANTISLAQAIEYEAHLQQLAAEHSDFAEGVAAFAEKRPPVWRPREGEAG